MAAYGYGAASSKACVAFESDVDAGAWGDVAIRRHDPDGGSARAS